MASLRFKGHAIIQMEERGLTVTDVRTALGNGEDIESRPDEDPYPARLVLGLCQHGPLHVAVRDNIEDDEIVVGRICPTRRCGSRTSRPAGSHDEMRRLS